MLLTPWDQDKMAVVFQTTFWNAFLWMKMYGFQLKFQWSLFPRVQFQHWFRQWLGTKQARSHYLKQWWPSFLAHICITWPQWVDHFQFSGRVCCLFGAKPSPEHTLHFCQWVRNKFSRNQNQNTKEIHLKMLSTKCWPSFSGFSELNFIPIWNFDKIWLHVHLENTSGPPCY